MKKTVKKNSVTVAHHNRMLKAKEVALQQAAADALENDRVYWAKCNTELAQTVARQRTEIDGLKSRAARIDANTKLILAIGQMVSMVTDNLRD